MVKKRCSGDAGFTLTELVIAMVVLGVLASIAVPSFLGSRNNAYDKEAQSSIEVVLRASKFLYQNQGDFSDASSAQCGDSAILAADLQKLEPNVDVVASSVSSTNYRVVSVQAVQTWSSNAELLGCQGFYAVAFSSSGSCWVGRFISEGKYLTSGSVSPVVVNPQTNTSNNAVTTWSALAVNGNAFGVLKPQTSAANGDNTNNLLAIKTACKAKNQSTGAASLSTNYIAPSQFYTSWRDTAPAGGISYAVGDTGPGGGAVFYVQAGGGTFTSTGSDCGTACKYFEAATSDQGAFADPWCSNTTSLLGVTATAIGSGMSNTTTADLTCTSGRIQISADYTNNGKTDWHLPSKDELNQLCKWQKGLAWISDATRCSGGTSNTGPGASGFSDVDYWSSSELNATDALYQAFSDGSQSTTTKGWRPLARPVRAFG